MLKLSPDVLHGQLYPLRLRRVPPSEQPPPHRPCQVTVAPRKQAVVVHEQRRLELLSDVGDGRSAVRRALAADQLAPGKLTKKQQAIIITTARGSGSSLERTFPRSPSIACPPARSLSAWPRAFRRPSAGRRASTGGAQSPRTTRKTSPPCPGAPGTLPGPRPVRTERTG